MVLWPTVLTHTAAVGGGIVLGSWLLRLSSDQMLRLIAGLVAIFARDERSRAARAIDVLRVVSQKDELRQGITRSRTAEKYSNLTGRHRPRVTSKDL